MHLALLGVSKLTLSLWVKETEIQSSIIEIEKRIKNIEVPSELREPRGLSDLKHWKGKIDDSKVIMKFTHTCICTDHSI